MPFSASSFLSSQQLLVIKYSTYIKICQWLHSNWWSLVQEATGLPQPLHNFKGISRGIISFALTNFLVPRYLFCRINFQLFINRSKFIHINQPKTFWQFLVHGWGHSICFIGKAIARCLFTTDLLFDWFGFNQTSKYVAISTKAA